MAADGENDVFINCPFDAEYRPLFEAMVFAIHACGFIARSAVEMDDGSWSRIDKLAEIIGHCRLGIHDISRTELDPVSALPRFVTSGSAPTLPATTFARTRTSRRSPFALFAIG